MCLHYRTPESLLWHIAIGLQRGLPSSCGVRHALCVNNLAFYFIFYLILHGQFFPNMKWCIFRIKGDINCKWIDCCPQGPRCMVKMVKIWLFPNKHFSTCTFLHIWKKKRSYSNVDQEDFYQKWWPHIFRSKSTKSRVGQKWWYNVECLNIFFMFIGTE